MARIGIFDSGYGGLTVFKEIAALLPAYDYVYLGDNARAPYGNLSFEEVYQNTLQSVEWLMAQDCDLVILACNTASAKALRHIQQRDLHRLGEDRRVLGVIRPTAEIIGNYSKSKKVGILGTKGTVDSGSYLIEIGRFFPDLKVLQQACPRWVPMVEEGAYDSVETEEVIKEDIQSLLKNDTGIDTVLLACTHYPLLEPLIRKHLPETIQLVSQGALVAQSLADYLKRHPEMEKRLNKSGVRYFYTTGHVIDFEEHATAFFGEAVEAKQIVLVNKS